MLTRTFSGALAGVDAVAVEVELNATGRGEESIVAIVGLPDTAIKESRDRIKSALFSCGYGHPQGHTLVNLAPAEAFSAGRISVLICGASLRARRAIGRAPLTGRTEPSSASSPRIIAEARFSRGTIPFAAISESAIGKSNAAPSFFISAGARLTSVCPCG